MRLVHYQPLGTNFWNQVHEFQNEMNRLFNRWVGEDRNGHFPESFPAVNVWDDAENVFVEAELPGFDPKDLEIHVTGGNQLTLKGRRTVARPEKAIVHRQERSAGSFVRILTLPFSVNPNSVEANFKDGVLLIEMPKDEAAKPRKIVVKS